MTRSELLLFLFTQLILEAALTPLDKCGDHLELDSPGYLTSPAFPFEYPPSQRCMWVITAPEPGQKILLNFNPHFYLEDRDCKHDYVEVYNGGDELSPLLGRFCGEIAPSPIISSSNQLLIKFVSDNETQGAGFSVRYELLQTAPECSRNFTAPQGVITTPDFPKEYPNNLNCTLMIFAPNTSEIVLEFDSFSMESETMQPQGSLCEYDWLEIWDALPAVGSRIGKYCGKTSLGRVISYTGILSMTIITDSSFTREGFSANYTIRERSLSSNLSLGHKHEYKCGENLELDSPGYLTSPAFPFEYPPSQRCVWVITAPEPGQKILLNFNPLFNLEDRDCKHDYVEVYNGGDQLSPLLGRFCGEIAPSPIISSGNQLLIKFVSDNETQGAGFSVHYEVSQTAPECSRNFTAPQGVITTPDFPKEYPNNLNCTLMIFAPNTSEIVLEFDSFSMESETMQPQGSLCEYDWLEIWDALPAVGSRIGKYCGKTSLGRVISYTGILSMTIITDSSITREGFSANYTIRERSLSSNLSLGHKHEYKCGDNLELDSPGYLTSPAFPFEYPSSQRCIWVITAPEPGQKILLNFNPLFYLEDRDCKHDYVEVYNGGDQLSPLLGRFCGEIAPSPIISSGNQLLIKFVSDNETQGAGFSVHYEVSQTAPECSRNFTAPQGVITTPDFPNKYPNKLNCTLMIFAPNTSEIVLEFDSFSMESETMLPQGSLCKYDWLEIWDGLPAVGSHIGRYCGTTSPGQVISYTGILSMTIITDSSFTREGFSANYTIRERSLSSNRSLGNKREYKCGDNLELDSPGYLTSPAFPFEYPPSQRCVWVITTPEPGQKILLNFNPLFYLEDRDCKHDYVEVYNGGDQLSPLLGRFCGKITPSPIISSGNQLLIKFVSDNETQGAGFSVHYEVSQTAPECSRNFTAPQGVITTPDFPNKYPNKLNCTLMIFAPNTSEIVLEFDSFSMESETMLPQGSICKYDWLEIWDGLPAVGIHIGRYCGTTSPGRVISYTGILSMTIITDSTMTREGFSANYTIRERSLSSNRSLGNKHEYKCGDNLELDSPGYLTSPGYPFEYPPSQRCVWVITTPEPGQKILLNFNPLFYLEDRDCKRDYVEVYNGGNQLSPLLGRFCGKIAPSPIISSSNQLLIKFVSDNETQEAGFSVRYEVSQTAPECSRNFTAPQGVITTPDFPKEYPNNLNCTLMIFAPNTSEIVLEFDSFSMEPDTMVALSNLCTYDWLEIWDGLPAVGTHIGKYCGTTSPGRVISYTGFFSMTIITDSSITREGFSANYTIRERSLSSNLSLGNKREYKCGDNLELDSPGYLTSPGYPFEYPPSQRCVWVITTPEPGQKILLNFNPLFYLEDRDCKHDYVEVYNGGDQLSPLLGRFCGEIAPSPIISSGNQLLIKFVSDNETQGAGFSVRYKVSQTAPECSRNFTAPQGIITTPDFPNKYPNKLNCTLMIFAPNTSEIVMEFDSFSMESETMLPQGSICKYDWLEIWDGLPAVGTHIGRYCGTTSPGQVISYTGFFSMTIITDSSITGEGFSANYTIRERSLSSNLSLGNKHEYKCGDNLELDSPGYLTSPAFPFEYPPSQRCVWVITAPEPGQKILLNFNPLFNLEDRDCKHDYVEVYNGGDQLSPLLGRFCGEIAPSPIISSSNQLLIKFVSDNETQGAGFSVRYEVSQTDKCGDNLELGSPGYLTSPAFPFEYPPSQRCVWVITAPEPGQKILLNFNPLFYLEDRDCKHDYVEVYNGGDQLSPLLGRFCGEIAPSPIISSSNQLLIKFVSDNETQGAGFSVHYEVSQTAPECSRNFTAPQGVITTPDFPNKYPNNLNCTLMIFAPNTSEIVLEFDSFSMESETMQPQGSLCKYDWLEIWDGLPAVGIHIGRYCGTTSPGRVISYTGIFSMTIITDSSFTREGFSANYTIRERSLSSNRSLGNKHEYKCGDNLELDSPGYLTSPGYPFEYPPSQRCVWVITVPEPGQKILLNFNPLFNLEDRDCKRDYVEVYNGGNQLSPLLGRFCGKIAPSPIISSSNQLLIKFVSDSETQEAGFSVRYEVSQTAPECSRNFTAPQGVITTPDFPKEYPNNLNCTLMIFAPNTSEIVLEFDSFSMESETMVALSNLCTYDWLEIWDGLPAVGSHIGRYCGTTSPGRVISYTGILSMTIITDSSITREGFSANYTIRERSLSSNLSLGNKHEYKCGNNLELDSPGYLTSPGYPFEYPPSQRCVWVITAPEPGQKILLNFNPHFYLEDRDCKHDYVEVYNGGDQLSPLLGRFCGEIAPSPIISSSNQLLIKFVSDNETQGAGFSVRYKVSQTAPECSRNFTAPQGVITTPDFPNKYPNKLNCTLMIFAPNTSEIVLEFDSFSMEPDTMVALSNLCTYDWLEIWDGLPAVGTHVGKYCGTTSPGQVISYTGILSMTIITDSSITREGFSANYSIRERSSNPGR
ncbi:cubilin-like isoform X4 [Trachinotus anak]|uniref:cubilin-like isoform X4 n=1 Tax=Trachinotus anak TaxID=443729 RepID=UPI0039F18B25